MDVYETPALVSATINPKPTKNVKSTSIEEEEEKSQNQNRLS